MNIELRQVDNKNCHWLRIDDGSGSGQEVLFSYATPVALRHPAWGAIRTAEKYSRTTSGHINREAAWFQVVPEAEFRAKLAAVFAGFGDEERTKAAWMVGRVNP